MNKDMRHYARLACIRFSDEELEKVGSDIETVLQMADALPDTDGELTVDPDNVMTLRKDVAAMNKYTRKELFASAPQLQAGCIVVPRTVE